MQQQAHTTVTRQHVATIQVNLTPVLPASTSVGHLGTPVLTTPAPVTTRQEPFSPEELTLEQSFWPVEDGTFGPFWIDDDVNCLTPICTGGDGRPPAEDFDTLLGSPLGNSWQENWFDTNEVNTAPLSPTDYTPAPSPDTCVQQPQAAIPDATQQPAAPLVIDAADLEAMLACVGNNIDDFDELLGGNGDIDGSETANVITLEEDHLESLVRGMPLAVTAWPHYDSDNAASSHDEYQNQSIADDDSSDEDGRTEDDSDSDASWGPSAPKKRRCAPGGPARQVRRAASGPRAASARSRGRGVTMDVRKKEQNKNAATRYREKKRAEEIENEIECEKLEKRNRELRARVDDMTHEISVLRGLIVDIFRGPAAAIAVAVN